MHVNIGTHIKYFIRNATEDLRDADSTDDEVSQINTRAEIKKELEKINAIKENGTVPLFHIE